MEKLNLCEDMEYSSSLFFLQVVSGLKQKIFKLEQQCKEKDNTIKYDFGGVGTCVG